jgi:hypothetical protein
VKFGDILLLLAGLHTFVPKEGNGNLLHQEVAVFLWDEDWTFSHDGGRLVGEAFR